MVKSAGWTLKQREGRRYHMKKKISGKAIAAIIAALAVVGIAVYLIISISKQVVNIDISGYNEVSITSGGTGKTITPSEEQRTHKKLPQEQALREQSYTLLSCILITCKVQQAL
jgi:hypothetical protein